MSRDPGAGSGVALERSTLAIREIVAYRLFSASGDNDGDHWCDDDLYSGPWWWPDQFRTAQPGCCETAGGVSGWWYRATHGGGCGYLEMGRTHPHLLVGSPPDHSNGCKGGGPRGWRGQCPDVFPYHLSPPAPIYA